MPIVDIFIHQTSFNAVLSGINAKTKPQPNLRANDNRSYRVGLEMTDQNRITSHRGNEKFKQVEDAHGGNIKTSSHDRSYLSRGLRKNSRLMEDTQSKIVQQNSCPIDAPRNN